MNNETNEYLGKNGANPDILAKALQRPSMLVSLAIMNKLNAKPGLPIKDIGKSIEIFSEWATKKANDNQSILQELEKYIKDLYAWLKEYEVTKNLSDIERQRLNGQRDRLIKRLENVTEEESQPQGKGGKVKDKKQKKRRKAPPQILKETRERQAAKELAKQPNITSRELGKILECNASTVTRLNAWQKKEILNSVPPNGSIERNEDGETSIEAIETDK